MFILYVSYRNKASHTLNGKYDCALGLDDIDFIAPIISVVEVKRSSLSDGLGQCIAEMYTTLKIFKQDQVYGIITDGEIWSFFLLRDLTLSVNNDNYYISNVSDIIDRIGYISERFQVRSQLKGVDESHVRPGSVQTLHRL